MAPQLLGEVTASNDDDDGRERLYVGRAHSVPPPTPEPAGAIVAIEGGPLALEQSKARHPSSVRRYRIGFDDGRPLGDLVHRVLHGASHDLLRPARVLAPQRVAAMADPRIRRDPRETRLTRHSPGREANRHADAP